MPFTPEQSNSYYHGEGNAKAKMSIRKYALMSKYGLTLEDYQRMLEEQNYCCAICGEHESNFSRRLAVDHDHKSGKVRALLCAICNQNLGVYENRAQEFERYLELFKELKEI